MSRNIAIIGGGIVGLFIAYYLNKLDSSLKIRIIDKSIDQKHKASIYNAGLITPSFSPLPDLSISDIARYITARNSPIRVGVGELFKNLKWFLKAYRSINKNPELGKRLAEISLNMYYRFINESNADLDMVKGVLALFIKSKDAEDMHKLVGGRLIDQKDIEEIGYKGFDGAVLIDNEIAINPAKLYRYLYEYISKQGIEFQTVDDLRIRITSDKRIAIFTGKLDKITYDKLIIAAGSWSRDICRAIGYDPYILPARGIVRLYRSMKEKIVDKPALLEDYGIGVSIHKNNVIRLTGYFELIGFNTRIKEDRVNNLIRIATKHIKMFNEDSVELIDYGMGFRPCTPDNLPVIGKVPGYEDIYIASGHCRLGVTLSPVTGHIIASMVNDRKPNIDEELLLAMSPDRFPRIRKSGDTSLLSAIAAGSATAAASSSS